MCACGSHFFWGGLRKTGAQIKSLPSENKQIHKCTWNQFRGKKKEQNKAIGGGTLFMAFGIQTGNQKAALRYRNSTFIRLVFVQKKRDIF